MHRTVAVQIALTGVRKVGDTVAAGQPIGELETEKATVEFESPAAGTLVEIVHAAGSEVAVGTVIAYIDDGK